MSDAKKTTKTPTRRRRKATGVDTANLVDLVFGIVGGANEFERVRELMAKARESCGVTSGDFRLTTDLTPKDVEKISAYLQGYQDGCAAGSVDSGAKA